MPSCLNSIQFIAFSTARKLARKIAVTLGLVLLNFFVEIRVQCISQWEEMISLAKAASQLLQHLLAQYGLAIRKRSVVLCGLSALLGKSLVLAKRGSSAFQSESKPFKERPEEGINIFKEAFLCLRESLQKQFGRKLLDASEEFQVYDPLYLFPC